MLEAGRWPWRPTQPGLLRIAHGRVWLTFDNAQQDESVRGGDHFLGAGKALQIFPGRGLVMESWNATKNSAVYFSWDPLPATAGLAITKTPRWMLSYWGQTPISLRCIAPHPPGRAMGSANLGSDPKNLINWTFTWMRPDGPMSYRAFAEEVITLLERGLAGGKMVI